MDILGNRLVAEEIPALICTLEHHVQEEGYLTGLIWKQEDWACLHGHGG